MDGGESTKSTWSEVPWERLRSCLRGGCWGLGRRVPSVLGAGFGHLMGREQDQALASRGSAKLRQILRYINGGVGPCFSTLHPAGGVPWDCSGGLGGSQAVTEKVPDVHRVQGGLDVLFLTFWSLCAGFLAGAGTWGLQSVGASGHRCCVQGGEASASPRVPAGACPACGGICAVLGKISPNLGFVVRVGKGRCPVNVLSRETRKGKCPKICPTEGWRCRECRRNPGKGFLSELRSCGTTRGSFHPSFAVAIGRRFVLKFGSEFPRLLCSPWQWRSVLQGPARLLLMHLCLP